MELFSVPNKRKLKELTKEENPNPEQQQTMSVCEATHHSSCAGQTTPLQLALEPKKGRGGKRKGAGRKKRDPLFQKILPICPSPRVPSGHRQILDEPFQMCIQDQVPLILSPFTEASNSSLEKDEDISIDKLVELVVILKQKLELYKKHEARIRQQNYSLKKEKEVLQWRLDEAIKQKEAAELQIANPDARLQGRFFFKSKDSSSALVDSPSCYASVSNQSSPRLVLESTQDLNMLPKGEASPKQQEDFRLKPI